VLAAVVAAGLLFVLVSGIPGKLIAQEEPEITTTSTADYEFGQTMKFSLTASGESEIEKVSLFISAPDLRRTLTTDVAIEPGKEVTATYSLDLTTVRLAPFTRVSYWWKVWDADGKETDIAEVSVEYADDQFIWETLENDGVRVHTTAEDSDLSQLAMDIVSETLPHLRAVVPVDAPRPLHIYLYPSESDLRAALRLTGREWIGSHAHPELGVVLVPAPDKQAAIGDLERTLPHELAHLLLFQALGDAYDDAPRWFDEGLATSFETTAALAREELLRESVSSDISIHFEDLCHVFPEDGGRFSLAYAESASLIGHVAAEYGNQALTDMIRAIADGADCQSLTPEVLGVSLSELEDDWRRHQVPESAVAQIWRQGAVFLLIAACFALLVLLLVVRSPRYVRDR
jgi:hypothetical protein